MNQLRKGDYLREDYIQALCESLSPLRATRPDDDPQLIVTDRDKDGAYLMPHTHNFHEGGDLYRPSKDGRFLQMKPDGLPDAPFTHFTLRIRGLEAFSLVRDHAELTFRFVGQAERWVSDAVIAGTYQDEKGRQYVFGPEGQALFPGNRRFEYTLGMDHVLTDYDYIYSKDLKTPWATSISPKGISISEVHGDFPNEVVSPIPTWRLTRLTPLACK